MIAVIKLIQALVGKRRSDPRAESFALSAAPNACSSVQRVVLSRTGASSIAPISNEAVAFDAALLPPPTAQDAADAALLLDAHRSALIVGLDCEWQPERVRGASHPVALVQLAFGAGSSGGGGGRSGAGGGPPAVLLAHVAHWPGGPSPALRAVLEDPTVLKVGVGIQQDAARLGRDYGVSVRGAVEVRDLLGPNGLAPLRHRTAAGARNGGAAAPTGGAPAAAGMSLQALAAAVLDVAVDKGEQLSDWGAARLTREQIAYAAADAWISRELALAAAAMAAASEAADETGCSADRSGPVACNDDGGPTHHHQQQQQQSAGSPAAAGRAVSELDAVRLLSRFARSYSAPPPTQRRPATLPGAAGAGAGPAAAVGADPPGFPGFGSGGGSSSTTSSGGEGGVVALPQTADAEALVPQERLRRLQERWAGLKPGKIPVKKGPLYENARIQAPDGTTLCTCGKSKVQWYLDRGLASVVTEDPLVIRLHFEPRGRGNLDDHYYLTDKENRCAACGAEEGVLRKSIVPHCYRQHFPEAMKSHLSHDVVLLCAACHQVSSLHDAARMAQLGRRHGAPLENDSQRYTLDKDIGAVRSAGRALLSPKGRGALPPERRARLEALLCSHFGAAEYSPALAAAAAGLQARRQAETWRSHAELVVAAVVAGAAGAAAAETAAVGEDQDGKECAGSSTGGGGNGGSSGGGSGVDGDHVSCGIPSAGELAALEAFVKDWRRHFLATMRPRFMPRFWSVDARVANSSVNAAAVVNAAAAAVKANTAAVGGEAAAAAAAATGATAVPGAAHRGNERRRSEEGGESAAALSECGFAALQLA